MTRPQEVSLLLGQHPKLGFKFTRRQVAQAHPLPMTKLISAPSPQKPPTQLSQPSQASRALRRPPHLNMTWLMAPQNHPSPAWKSIHVPSPQIPLPQPPDLRGPAARLPL